MDEIRLADENQNADSKEMERNFTALDEHVTK